MEIRAIAKYPVKMLKRTWLGDFARLVRIAFTPISEKSDTFVRKRNVMSVQEAKQGIMGVITPKDIRNMKKRVFSNDFLI